MTGPCCCPDLPCGCLRRAALARCLLSAKYVDRSIACKGVGHLAAGSASAGAGMPFSPPLGAEYLTCVGVPAPMQLLRPAWHLSGEAYQSDGPSMKSCVHSTVRACSQGSLCTCIAVQCCRRGCFALAGGSAWALLVLNQGHAASGCRAGWWRTPGGPCWPPV